MARTRKPAPPASITPANGEVKLTIGMSHYADFDGVYFTIQAIRLYNPELLPRIEFVVVDNSPAHPDGQMVRGYLNSVPNSKYIEMLHPSGTSPTRNRVFAEASNPYVLCLDCHVLLAPGALQALFKYYEQYPTSSDLIQGPLLYDPLNHISTHFDDTWRSEMWGTWGQAWKCSCGHERAINFSMLQREGQAVPRVLCSGLDTDVLCPYCKKRYNARQWAGHEKTLVDEGCTALGYNGTEAFEIPGQGLGLFSCRKEAWLGFNQHARGFGGEEMYIHGKYRRAGHKALCLPELKWNHRFGRPSGPPYPVLRYLKVRNYVLEFQEMGWDLEPVFDHFVATGLIKRETWDALTTDAIALETEPKVNSTCGGCSGTAPDFTSVDEAFNRVSQISRDLDKHMPKLRELASKCEHVTEFSGRRESTIALVAAKPKIFVSHNTESDGWVSKIYQLLKNEDVLIRSDNWHSGSVGSIEETDLLFLDTKHTYEALDAELGRFGKSVRRYIVLHDTNIFGTKGEDGGIGMIAAIRNFCLANPEWQVIYHTPEQYGLTVLGKNPEDYLKEPFPLFEIGHGPGTELKALIASMGIQSSPTCDCNARAIQMDIWGIEGCEKNKDTIVGWLSEGQTRWGWAEKVAAAARAVKTGLAFRLDLSDPFRSLVDIAIRNAEKKQK
jgi:hypothetical protein